MRYKVGDEVTIAHCEYAKEFSCAGCNGVIVENTDPELFDYLIRVEDGREDFFNDDELV